MSDSWKSDPRLAGIDPERLALFSGFAEQLKAAPGRETVNAFLSVSRLASEQGVRFTKAESELLISILSEDLSPEEKKRVEIARVLMGRMGRPGK